MLPHPPYFSFVGKFLTEGERHEIDPSSLRVLLLCSHESSTSSRTKLFECEALGRVHTSGCIVGFILSNRWLCADSLNVKELVAILYGTVMATLKILVPCIVLLIYFTSSAYGFIEGLYCGTENCYDGMNLFWLNLLANEDDQLQSMLVSISSLRVTCMYSYLLTHLYFCIWIIVLGVYRESSKVIYSRFR